MEFKIREGLFSDFQTKIEKLNKKAVKLNVKHSTIEVVDEVVEDNIIYKVVRINEGDDVRINGWNFKAKLERNIDDSFLIKGDSNDIPQEVKDVRTCQHCNTNRRRNLYFILQNEETNEYIVVGKTCLIDFIGHKDAEKIANYYSMLNDCIKEYEDMYNDREYSCGGFYNDFAYDIKDVIKASVVSIDDRGYHKSNSEYSTKQEVLNILNLNPHVRDLIEKYETMKNDDIKHMLDFILGMDSKNDFINNLQTIIKDKYVRPNLLGYAVCIPTVFHKEQEKLKSEEEKIKNTPPSEYIGSVKDRVTLRLTYDRFIKFDGYYGSVFIEFFKDESGNVVVWKTSTCKELEMDTLYEVTCTIKEHTEYRGVKQTYINRPKFKELKKVNVA